MSSEGVCAGSGWQKRKRMVSLWGQCFWGIYRTRMGIYTKTDPHRKESSINQAKTKINPVFPRTASSASWEKLLPRLSLNSALAWFRRMQESGLMPEGPKQEGKSLSTPSEGDISASSCTSALCFYWGTKYPYCSFFFPILVNSSAPHFYW